MDNSALKVLIVEDEVKLARFVELELKHEGYEVIVANDGRSALEKFEEEAPKIILLDLMLPGLSGIEVCRRIRKTSDVPIIMITAKGEVMDKVMGLDNGADDYITKPFAIEEVLARMRVALKHKRTSAAAEGEKKLTVKDLTLDLGKRTVKLGEHNIDLTKREFDLLAYLIKNKNIVISREQILNKVWGYDYFGETNIVDVYVRYLRTKIDDKYNEKFIHTIRGVGYYVKDDEE
ncbi:MAG: response regulator transcription factor [Clostridiales bacterium]|nr:response regulator transcription factor [Clostridiales bacterium]